MDAIRITEPGFFNQPDYYEVLAALRRDAPVAAAAEPATWLVSRYDDIRAISRDPERFSSARGVLVNDPLRAPDAHAIEGSILHMDPPDHGRYRGIVNRSFTPRAVGGMEERVTEVVDRVVSELPADETVDFVEHVAASIPVLVIAELLGVGDGVIADFKRWSDAMIEITDAPDPATFQTTVEFFMYLDGHIADREATPRDDMITMLTQSGLSRQEIVMFCVTLLVAGNETTRHLLSGGAAALAAHPDQRAELASSPDLMTGAVEELLRWVTPIQAMGRTAKVDVDVAGQAVAAGDFLVFLYASGNRDAYAFGAAADRLDVRRPVDTTHVAFGFGEHLCLGASLARLEARITFNALLARFPNYELAGEPDLVASTLVRGATRMPVAFTP